MPNRFLALLLGCTALTSAFTAPAQEPGGILGRAVPQEILDPPWLDARRDAELATRDDFSAFIGFGFTDRLPESGITFRNRVVEDAAMTYKAVHYDHGNGIAVADVDGDGLLDLYFSNQVGANELWRNLGDGRFEDITQTAGVGVVDRIGVTASFADVDNDGDPDLYVTTVRQGNLLFRNRGDGRFEDVTAASGLGHKAHSSGAVFFDFDNDGWLDLFLTNVGVYTDTVMRVGRHGAITYRFPDGYGDAFGGHRYPERTELSRLYRNRGDGTFEDATDRMDPPWGGWSGDATAMDVNGDGWTDLYVLNMQGDDAYYQNLGGEKFVERRKDVFPMTSWGAMGVESFDWNNDGRMDLYVTDMHSDMSKEEPPDREHLKSDMQWNEEHLQTGGMSIFGNSFFEQQADGSFLERSDALGLENYWPWGFSSGDLNADGWIDLFVAASMNYPFRYQTNQLLINDAGERFRSATFLLGIEPRRKDATAQAWFDLDCGGVHREHKLCTGASGHVQAWGALGTRSSVIFDLDGDGDLDIVTNEFNGVPQVLISDLAAQRPELHWLKVRPVGSASNRGGLGARVTVEAGGRRLTQVLDGKSGYLSQSLMPLYFGLGEAGEVEAVTVRWTSGRERRIENPAIDQLLTIEEPE